MLELSNARRALSALIEQDADGYTITAAIEHARRVGVDAEVRFSAEKAKAEAAHGGIHMPHQSIYPFVASLGLLIAAVGIAVIDHDPSPGFWGKKIGLSMIGGVVMLAGIYFWALEGNEGYHLHLDDEGHAPTDKNAAKH